MASVIWDADGILALWEGQSRPATARVHMDRGDRLVLAVGLDDPALADALLAALDADPSVALRALAAPPRVGRVLWSDAVGACVVALLEMDHG